MNLFGLLDLYLFYWLICIVVAIAVSFKNIRLLIEFGDYGIGRVRLMWKALCESIGAFSYGVIMTWGLVFVINGTLAFLGIDSMVLNAIMMIIASLLPIWFMVTEMKLFFSTEMSLLRAHIVQV